MILLLRFKPLKHGSVIQLSASDACGSASSGLAAFLLNSVASLQKRSMNCELCDE